MQLYGTRNFYVATHVCMGMHMYVYAYNNLGMCICVHLTGVNS